MKPAEQITAYLKANTSQDSPISRAALKDALGHLDRKVVTDRLHRQIERGMVGSDERGIWHVRDREYRKPKVSAEEKRAKKRARENAQRRATGILPRSLYDQQRARARAERLESRKIEAREKRKAQREAREKAKLELQSARLAKIAQKIAIDNQRKRERQIKQENVARDKRKAASQIVAMRQNATVSAVPSQSKAPEFPDTDAWLAQHRNDPAKFQRLPAGAWSNPLRFEY